MSAKQLMFVAIASILTIVGIVAIVVMDSEGDVAGGEFQSDSNRVSYSVTDYTTGVGTEYVFDVVGYAASDQIENNHTKLTSSKIIYKYSTEASPYIFQNSRNYGQEIRIPVIYSASVDGKVQNYYLVEYKLIGNNGKPYFGSLAFRSVTYIEGGGYNIGSATDTVEVDKLGIALIPSTFTFEIPSSLFIDKEGLDKSLYEGIDEFIGESTTYNLSSVASLSGTPCLKTLIILGSPQLKANFVYMPTLETVIFGGGSLSFNPNASMVPSNKETSLTNIYFDTVESSTILANNVVCRYDQQAINIYLKSDDQTKISDKFGSNDCSLKVNIYFSKDSTFPIQQYGNGSADKIADDVVFHIHKDSDYWSKSDKSVAVTIETEDVAPEVFEYPAYRVTVSDCENGSVSVATNYKPGDYALPGSTVALYPIPADGYIVESITYTCDGVATAVSRSDDGKYYFTMPSKNVSIGAVFKEALPKIESTYTLSGSQLDISLMLTGSYSDKVPDKVCVYVKYANADSTEAYSFAKMTVRISNYSSGYALSVTSSMSSLTPIEYLIQVYSGDTMVSNVLKEVE